MSASTSRYLTTAIVAIIAVAIANHLANAAENETLDMLLGREG